jgi:hypothetical protein
VNAYLCTYRHKNPHPKHWERTREAAADDQTLSKFLGGWDHSYYDWGDDPSFFAAQELLGDVRETTWGVCRPDVRKALNEGDVVVFFCGCQRDDKRVWCYHFVGFGKVRALVRDRACLWTNSAYVPYHKFYNVLGRLEGRHLVRSESFHPYHKNWEGRASAPYVVFDSASSFFNLTAPHCVATWERGNPAPELWKTDDRSTRIEQFLFVERRIQRRLRTSVDGHPHPKLNLLRDGRGNARPGRSLPELTQALSELV